MEGSGIWRILRSWFLLKVDIDNILQKFTKVYTYIF